MVQFAIWERGDIGVEQLSGRLKLSLRHALCDLLAEYYLLTAPLSKVPDKYCKTQQITRPRSCSEPCLEKTLTPKSPAATERSSKRRLDFYSHAGFRGRKVSSGGHRQTSSTENTMSSGSTGRHIQSFHCVHLIFVLTVAHAKNGKQRQTSLCLYPFLLCIL